CSNHIKLIRTRQNLLQENICNRVFDKHFTCCQSIVLGFICSFFTVFFNNPVILCPCKHFISEFFFSHFIAPCFKGTVCELHDISFVYQCDVLASFIQCIFNTCTHQTFCPFFGNGLHADA